MTTTAPIFRRPLERSHALRAPSGMKNGMPELCAQTSPRVSAWVPIAPSLRRVRASRLVVRRRERATEKVIVSFVNRRTSGCPLPPPSAVTGSPREGEIGITRGEVCARQPGIALECFRRLSCSFSYQGSPMRRPGGRWRTGVALSRGRREIRDVVGTAEGEGGRYLALTRGEVCDKIPETSLRRRNKSTGLHAAAPG